MIKFTKLLWLTGNNKLAFLVINDYFKLLTMNKDNKYIDELKQEVDEVDDFIAKKLLERKKLTSEILDMKFRKGIPFKDINRENKIVKRLQQIYGSNDKNLIRTIYNIIFRNSLKEHEIKYCREKIKTIDEALALRPLIIAGPCAVESKEQITKIAKELSERGIKFLRGGAFKPRTSPDTFQGLGDEGIKLIREAADRYKMFTVTEALETKQLEKHYCNIDIIQIGSRNMASYGFIKEVARLTAKDKKTVLLKRGFNATLNELIYAAKYILDAGNPNVILCLRGIRTFEQLDSDFRFTPDLADIIELKEKTNLPVIFDPSHSTGSAKYVLKIAKVALCAGSDGLLIETHNNPKKSLSDAEQAIMPKELLEFLDRI
jgi:3-deoxy-7-phosphoheptulonate synthase / chorismate mutase